MPGLTSGHLLVQRYRLGRRIAIGGMGEVWQATDVRLDRQVAVKVLKPELSGDAEFRYRFHAEARMTASLNHPGIAAVHDYGEAASDPEGSYLVMELVTGDPLATILMHHPRLSVDRTLDILGQAGDALQAAHERGLVHRDVKPGNILITPAGRVKITDFGIARAVDAVPVTRNGMVLGTAHYLAPEQAAGNEAGPAADVYSLAVVGYECLAGQRPFVAESAVSVAMMHIRDRPPPLPADVPSAVRALIDATLVKDPRQRYRTGGEFAAAVAAVRAGHQLPLPRSAAVSGSPTGSSTGSLTAVLPSSPPQRWPDRRDAVRIAAVLLGVCTLIFGGYLVRAALRSPVPSSGSGPLAGVSSGPGTSAVPALPGTPRPLRPEPTKEQPDPELIDPDEAPPEVLITPTDYMGHRGSDAVVRAKSQGLIPRVVDDDGELVDPDRRSQCRIIEVNPLAGPIPRGSTLELTCRRGK
ncbi:MAG: serine/threonine-protein kinase [Pseudonocardiaceae bacterium]